VRLTADGVPVVVHDPTIERTTAIEARVRDLTLDQLRQADAGSRFSTDRGRTFPYRGKKLVIPTLVEVLRAFPLMPFLIELKEVEAQEAVHHVVTDEGATLRCVLASDDAAALTAFCEEPFARASCRQEISALYWGVLLRKQPAAAGYRLLSVPARYRGLTVPTRRFVAAARALGCPVHVWTVDEPGLARRLWANGVAGIVTNVPDRIRAVR
jgi:glycerophosphoryl diester phosphodiesterase